MIKRGVAALLCLFLIGIIYFVFSNPPPSSAEINTVIFSSLTALKNAQLPTGEFTMSSCGYRESGERCVTDSTPVFTAYVLSALELYKENPILQDVIPKAIEFLKSESVSSSVWRSTTSLSGAQNLRPDIVDQVSQNVLPDFDTTALVSQTINFYTGTPPENKEIIREHQTPEGAYFLWHKQANGEQNPEVDCGAVLNVALYLGNENLPVCDYMKKILTSQRSCSLYYPDGPIIDYLVGRAYENGVHCLGELRMKILERLAARRHFNGSYGNELETAFAVSTRIRFSDTSGIQKSVSWLLSQVKQDGFWDRQVLYSYRAPKNVYYTYGSKELTTGFVLEALALYKNHVLE